MSSTDSPNGSNLVRYSREGQVAYISLNRPEKLNAFNDRMVVDLQEALTHFDRDGEAGVAVLHGEGASFSSGADVRERQLRAREELEAYGGPEATSARHAELMYQAVNWKPIIAAVHGYALGMALGLALQCELVVAAEDAKFQVTEVPRGLHGSRYWALMQFRGAGTLADELVITGRYFSGKEAAEAGLITTATAGGGHLERARQYANDILANPPLSVRAAVRARRWYLARYERESEVLREYQPALHLSKDFKESATAFAEKRTAVRYQGD